MIPGGFIVPNGLRQGVKAPRLVQFDNVMIGFKEVRHNACRVAVACVFVI
jgi:hypothetical protein